MHNVVIKQQINHDFLGYKVPNYNFAFLVNIVAV